MSSGVFAKELEVYRQHQSEWLTVHVDSFVAIQGEQVDGFYGSYAEAFQSGLARFGTEHEFLIKQVSITEPVYFIS
jgi:hypothetical protein